MGSFALCRKAFGRILSSMVFMILAGILPFHVGGADFLWEEPHCLTSGFHAPETNPESSPFYRLDNYRCSRNAARQMAFDSSGTLHLAYWSGFQGISPQSPSAVYYQSWKPNQGWSPQTVVDQSYSDDPNYLGQRMGGRHPSLAVGPDDRVWVSWQDHRHCSIDAPGNGIDNIEIYCDAKPATGTFSATDTRITQTSASHYGDNAYISRVQAAPDGKVSILWYDFHLNNGDVADLYMATSDSQGVFDTSLPITDLRLTKGEDRGSGFTAPSFTTPDLAIGTNGERYAVWTDGFGGTFDDTGAGLYFAELPEQPAYISYNKILEAHDGFWYPAKIKVAPSGDLWIACTVKVSDYVSQVRVMRRPSGQSNFQNPFTVTTQGVQRNADLAVDAQNRLHLVWEENLAFQNSRIHYALLEDNGQTVLRQEILTVEDGAWATPSIVLDPDGFPCVVFSEGDSDILGAQGDIWFVRAVQAPASAQRWQNYP